MVNQNKNVFLQALIVTMIVFFIGLVLGFYLEKGRVSETELALLNSDINILDEQIRSQNINVFGVDCKDSIRSTFDFADRIYQEAQLLEEYDSSNKFTSELKIIHKKYDLLRMMLWIKSIETREECPENFHTVVYLFEYSTDEIEQKARQNSMSKLLKELKEAHPDEILLVPIAGNLDLESINLIKEKYGIKKLPAMIIDENKMIITSPTLQELENIIFENDSSGKFEGILYEKINFNKPEKIILNSHK